MNIDPGLIEVLNIKIKDISILPENTWFDSISKYIYEKLKNEEVFLNNFYQSSAYKKLLLELDHEHDIEMSHENVVPNLFNNGGNGVGGSGSGGGNSSDNNSGELLFDEDEDDDDDEHTHPPPQFDDITMHNDKVQIQIQKPIKEEQDIKYMNAKKNSFFLDPNLNFKTTSTSKHFRSISDCTGITIKDIDAAVGSNLNDDSISNSSDLSNEMMSHNTESATSFNKEADHERNVVVVKQKLSAKIINTAIHCEGQYAVYAIQVSVIEDNQHKSWHIYRRYSKFLELKKILVKRFAGLTKLPFPAKKAFQNTQRSVLEHRMNILNEFLDEICIRAELNEDMNIIIRDFLEPDTNDKKIHGGAVIRTV